jgi:crotonobetainyl-CoA:carnitine CoA-transferase CaiB-like acyl-CoA transferase
VPWSRNGRPLLRGTDIPPLLAGLRVVEVALLAPNSLGMHLADLGADVVKVEEPGRGDYTRSVGAAKVGGLSMLHLRWNRGKRSAAIDLRRPEGAAVFESLAAKAEVVIEGLRAGALARRGLGPDELRRINPALVFCSLSGFGQTGPYRDLATHGVAYDAYAGHAPPERSAEGFPTIPRRYVEIGTHAGALYGAMAVLAAVLHARATGEGSSLDIAQADAAVAWQGARLDTALTGADPGSAPNLAESVRYQYYETSDGKHIIFQASERHFFENFCRALGRDDLLSRGVGGEVGEHARGDVDLREQLAKIFATRTREEWVTFFLEHDVPGGPVYGGAEVRDDTQFRARARIIEHEHAVAGRVLTLGPPIGGVAFPDPVRPAPGLGEHTEEVLGEWLGYEKDRIEALRASAVIAGPSG